MFTYFGFFGSHFNSSVGFMELRLQNVLECTNTRASGMGGFFLTCWITGIFEQWTPYYRNCTVCLKLPEMYWKLNGDNYRGLKFPQKSVVLLLLESDAACTSLNDRCAWKSALLVLVWCRKSTGDREQHLWSYWSPEGYFKKCYDKAKCYGCLCKKCGLRLKWSSNFAVSRTLAKHSDTQSENPGLRTL